MESFPNTYHCLSSQMYSQGEFKLVPIRYKDRYKVMQWRNEQMFHLRQTELLTKKKQDWYFENVVAKLFENKKPDQILFSFLKHDECYGYGGLVHINWVDKNAEISFLFRTDDQKYHFEQYWLTFLELIQNVAFDELDLHKIYTYSFDVRPELYPILNSAGFKKDAILNEHGFFKGKYIDVHIDYILNKNIEFIPAEHSDVDITYQWAIDPAIRAYAIQKGDITWDVHQNWFRSKLEDQNCKYFLIYYRNEAIGSFRLDIENKTEAKISYLLSSLYHGKGFGRKVLEKGVELSRTFNQLDHLMGQVFDKNLPSMHLFQDLGFKEVSRTEDGLVTFKMKLK